MDKTKTKTKKSQVITCRLPYQVYEDYEIRCIELQIEMSKLLKETVEKFLKEKQTSN